MTAKRLTGARPRIAVSDREKFKEVLASGPILRSDAIVLLTGDGEVRGHAAVELFKQGAAPVIVVTGGLDHPPHSLKASALAGKIMAGGVAHDRIIVDDESLHTQAQAAFVLGLAKQKGWTKLLLVASAYHAPRAFLTFLRALLEDGSDHTIRLIMVPASHAPWFGAPDGLTATRFDLIGQEAAKCEQYREHVASFAQGLAYLKYWENR